MNSIPISKSILVFGIAVVTAAILISSSVWMTTTTTLPSAFATANGVNDAADDNDDSLAERIVDDVNRRVDETLSELPTSPPTGGGGGGGSGGSASCDGRTATIVGTSGPDQIDGTIGDDVIAGLGGDDIIWGSGGNDVICGDDGNDLLDGDFPGNNPKGNDRVFGGSGDDGLEIIDQIRGNDRADGGTGNDKCNTDSGDVFINCKNSKPGIAQ